jgi:protein-S-isoprenylcysteine O-methyltransferase Ste14
VQNKFRHLFSLILPILVAGVFPYLLRRGFAASDSSWADAPELALFGKILGVVVFVSGLALFSWCFNLFFRVGKGTLMPWDPTTKLVAVGPYQIMRNPMISSVAMLLLGEALFLGSTVLGIWLLFFFLTNHFYFIFSEEPGLEKRFGEPYRKYRAEVPRWLPRNKA